MVYEHTILLSRFNGLSWTSTRSPQHSCSVWKVNKICFGCPAPKPPRKFWPQTVFSDKEWTQFQSEQRKKDQQGKNIFSLKQYWCELEPKLPEDHREQGFCFPSTSHSHQLLQRLFSFHIQSMTTGRNGELNPFRGYSQTLNWHQKNIL